MSSLLPPSSSTKYEGVVVTPEQHFERAVIELQNKATRIIDKFQSTDDIVKFSERVQKITSLFIALMAANSQFNGHVKAVSPINSPRNVLPSQALQAITSCFNEAIVNKEADAQQAYKKNEFDNAFRGFSVLAKALMYEKGSDRYFFIQASSLAVLVGQKKIAEAIQLLLALEVAEDCNGIPGAFVKWHANIRKSIVDIVQREFGQNEKVFEEIRDGIESCSHELDGILSKESLEKDNGFSHYLRLLNPVEERLDALATRLGTCKRQYESLAKLCALLNLKTESHCQAVSASFDQSNALCKSAKNLLESLNHAESTEEKNTILGQWITRNIRMYDCSAQKLSALHSWALSLLGKFYFSNQLTDDGLNATVALMRNHAQTLFTHLKAFPCDVQLQFGIYRLDISLLVLATISQRLQNEYCSAEQIGTLRTWSFAGFVSALPLLGRQKKVQEKPTVDLSSLMHENFEHIKDPENILNQLLTAFAKNQYQFKLGPEETVALFEIAYDLLEMPAEIADLSINPLHTTELEEKLWALLWLRLVQARRLSLPYSSLEAKLPLVSSDDFLQWIALYDPTRNEVDPAQHDRLFFAITTAAERLIKDKLVFNEQQVGDIFSFILKLYADLLELNIETKTKHTVDTKLIQFGARCVARANNPQHYVEAPCLAKLKYLDSQALVEIREFLLPTVRGWLETTIFPKLTTLILHSGIHSDDIGDFTKCAGLTTLSMPLTGENSDVEVQALAQSFPELRVLELYNGQVLTSTLNSFTLAELKLSNIRNELDFVDCKWLQQHLEYFFLHNVSLVPNSVSWVAASKRLKSVSIAAAQGEQIGCLARSTQIHAHPTLQNLMLQLACIDDDVELQDSLVRLINSQSTLNSITLYSATQQSLLRLLLRASKATAVKELTITCNPNEQLELLAEFKHLQKVTFLADDPAQHQRIQAFDFRVCQNLPQYSVISSSGQAMFVPVKK